MYRLTLYGTPIGQEYENKYRLDKAFKQLVNCVVGLGWKKV